MAQPTHRFQSRVVLIVLVEALLLSRHAVAQSTQPAKGQAPEIPPARLTQLQNDTADWDRQNRQQFDADPAYLLRPALIAQKKAAGDGEITLRGYATGLSGTVPVEFFLIGPNSSKNYEALAVSFAKPSDVHAALEFIGLPPGRPVDYARLQFFPKGERVRMTFTWDETSPDGVVSQRTVRAEDLIVLRQTGQPLPPTALTFVGGRWLKPEPGSPLEPLARQATDPRGIYYADLGDPGSIASNYNDATTVLDLPLQARQSDVYQSRIANPDYLLRPGTPVTITLTPDSPGKPRVLDLTLTARSPARPADSGGGGEAAGRTQEGGAERRGEGGTAKGTGDGGGLRLVATTADHRVLFDVVGAGSLAPEISRLLAEREPFVTVNLDPELPLAAVRDLYARLEALQDRGVLRIEPPASSPTAPPDLFYEALVPEEKYRDARNRPFPSFELHLAGDRVVLRDLAEQGDEPRDNPVTSPLDFQKMLADRADRPGPLAVFAPASMSYGQLLTWLRTTDHLAAGRVVWVYLPRPSTP